MLILGCVACARLSLAIVRRTGTQRAQKEACTAPPPHARSRRGPGYGAAERCSAFVAFAGTADLQALRACERGLNRAKKGTLGLFDCQCQVTSCRVKISSPLPPAKDPPCARVRGFRAGFRGGAHMRTPSPPAAQVSRKAARHGAKLVRGPDAARLGTAPRTTCHGQPASQICTPWRHRDLVARYPPTTHFCVPGFWQSAKGQGRFSVSVRRHTHHAAHAAHHTHRLHGADMSMRSGALLSSGRRSADEARRRLKWLKRHGPAKRLTDGTEIAVCNAGYARQTAAVSAAAGYRWSCDAASVLLFGRTNRNTQRNDQGGSRGSGQGGGRAAAQSVMRDSDYYSGAY